MHCQHCQAIVPADYRRTFCKDCKRALEISSAELSILTNAGYNVRRPDHDDSAWEWINSKIRPGAIVHSTLQPTAMDAWVLAWFNHRDETAKTPAQPVPKRSAGMTLTVGDLKGILDMIMNQDAPVVVYLEIADVAYIPYNVTIDEGKLTIFIDEDQE